MRKIVFFINIGFIEPQARYPALPLECLIDIEYKTCASTAEPIVESHVDTFFELPTVTDAGVGQHLSESESAKVDGNDLKQ